MLDLTIMTPHQNDTNHSETESGGQRQHWRDRKIFWYWILAGFILAQLFFFKIGLLEGFLLLAVIMLFKSGGFLIFVVNTIFLLICFYPISIIFYAWTWRGDDWNNISKHSIFLLLLLCITYPFQISWYVEYSTGMVDENTLSFLDEHPSYFVFEFLDSIILLGLCVWLVRRSRPIRPWDILVFHLFLFIALIWSMRFLQVEPAGSILLL